jgi:hypothetical protein
MAAEMDNTFVPGTPVCAIRNAVFVVGDGLSALRQRWLTTVNYDVLIYPDGLVVARGLSWSEFPAYRRERQEGREQGQSSADIHVARVRRASETPMKELLAADRRNRIIQTEQIVTAWLKRRWGFCTLTIHVRAGERLKLKWLNLSRVNGDCDEIASTLASVLGDRLKAQPRREPCR